LAGGCWTLDLLRAEDHTSSVHISDRRSVGRLHAYARTQ
jgi:hypothetical protein